MSRFPRVTVAYTVLRPMSGAVVHEGSFRMDDDMERRAFGERCNAAIADGYEVRTVRADLAERAEAAAVAIAKHERETLVFITDAIGAAP